MRWLFKMILLNFFLLCFAIKEISSGCSTKTKDILLKYSYYPRRDFTVNELKCRSYTENDTDVFDNHYVDHYNGFSIRVTHINSGIIKKNFFPVDYGFNYEALPIFQIFLSNLNITKIEPGAFNHVSRLHELHLDHNNLTDIDNVSAGYELMELNLGYNTISYLKNDTFRYMSHIKILLLNNNNITTLNQAIFDRLSSLKILDISENPLSHADIRLSVVKLKLNSLNLTNIDSFIDKIVLSNRPNVTIEVGTNPLEELYVKHNRIKNLDHSIFRRFSIVV